MDLCYLTRPRISNGLALRMQHLGKDGIFFKAQKTANSTQVQFVVAWTPELRAVVERAKPAAGLASESVAAPWPVQLTAHLPDHRGPAVAGRRGGEGRGREPPRPPRQGLTEAKRQGKDATALAGHADERMTERYIRLRETLVVFGPSIRRLIDAGSGSQSRRGFPGLTCGRS